MIVEHPGSDNVWYSTVRLSFFIRAASLHLAFPQLFLVSMLLLTQLQQPFLRSYANNICSLLAAINYR